MQIVAQKTLKRVLGDNKKYQIAQGLNSQPLDYQTSALDHTSTYPYRRIVQSHWVYLWLLPCGDAHKQYMVNISNAPVDASWSVITVLFIVHLITWQDPTYSTHNVLNKSPTALKVWQLGPVAQLVEQWIWLQRSRDRSLAEVRVYAYPARGKQ